MIAVDTSVLVAAFATWHGGHEQSIRALTRGVHLVAHAALETYSVLTRMPPPHRVRPDAAQRFLKAASSLDWLILDQPSHVRLIESVARDAITGGAVYDALVGTTSAAAGATLLTRDTRAVGTYQRLGISYEVIE